ncbi:MAG: ATP-dependent zinc protease family protein [Gammaproteobacteria bacterium]
MKRGIHLVQIGWREWVELPELGIPGIKAKIDTGARTSALHAFRVEEFEEQGQKRVRFRIHPLQHRTDVECQCITDIIDTRVVSDSGGHREQRPVIRTRIKLGSHEWTAEITLTNREDMLFRMLLGRTAIVEGGWVINPAGCYLGAPSLRRRYPHRERHKRNRGSS